MYYTNHLHQYGKIKIIKIIKKSGIKEKNVQQVKVKNNIQDALRVKLKVGIVTFEHE